MGCVPQVSIVVARNGGLALAKVEPWWRVEVKCGVCKRELKLGVSELSGQSHLPAAIVSDHLWENCMLEMACVVG